jgi:hypothetical protein
MRAELIGLLVGIAALGAACSFVTSFPDIEVVGGGSNVGGNAVGGNGVGGNGVGGDGANNTGGDPTGGSVPCVMGGCQNCLSAAGSCPVPGTPVRLVAPASTPDPMAATNIEIMEILEKSDGLRYVGNFRDVNAMGLDTGGADMVIGNQQAGIVLGPAGVPITIGGACDDSGVPGGDEVVFTAATVADSEIVIAGVFEGARLVLSPSSVDCMASPVVDATPTAGDAFAPFLIWLNAGDDTVKWSLSPIGGTGTDNGYLTDVAAFPGGELGRVAAIGVATRDPFNKGADFSAGYQYYALVSSGPVPTVLAPLGLGTCGASAGLDGLRSSIAVDSQGQVWAAGTGCTVGQEGQGYDESFVMRFDDETLEDPAIEGFGDASNPIGITEIVASDTMIIMAGTYSGSPIPTLADGSDTPTGQDTDGFVMAYDRAGWSNQSEPIWFQRIASDSGDASVETLAVQGGRVFVGGKMGAGGGIGDAQGCWASVAMGRGRSYFAQLSEETGSLDWLHVEGFEARESADPSLFFARGMALLPTLGEDLETATGFHGEMLLDCDSSATNAASQPEVHLRLFNLQ